MAKSVKTERDAISAKVVVKVKGAKSKFKAEDSVYSTIFKAYDIRGVYNDTLTEAVVYKIGRALAHFLKEPKIIVGTDMRVSSPSLSKALMKGICDQGTDVIHIGEVCTDAVYFASGFLDMPGAMFTASHNPPQYNGIKLCKRNAIPMNEDTGLSSIRKIAENEDFLKSKPKKFGKITEKDILNDYVKHVHKFADVKKFSKLTIACDAGNGMAGKIVPMVYKGLPVKIVPLYFKLDGTFPNHLADPSKFENLADLQKAVIREKCDYGMAFDGDADRIFFVDEKGKPINSSLISSLIVKYLLSKTPRQKIIHNVVCSNIVPETISKYGGTPIIERVGHSFIKDTMRKTKALFACEHSAHYYFRDNFRADSGIIASLIVSEIISREKKPLSKLLDEFRKYHTIEETNAEVHDKEAKMDEIEAIYRKLKPTKVSRMDGVSIYFKDWHFNVRPSNTEPLLRLNLEADTEEMMYRKKEELLRLMRG